MIHLLLKNYHYKFTAVYMVIIFLSCIICHKTGIFFKKNTGEIQKICIKRRQRSCYNDTGKLQADKAVKMQEIFLLLSKEKTCMIGSIFEFL